MNPAIPKLLKIAATLVAARVSKDNLTHSTTIAAAASATAALTAPEVLPADSPEVLITQAVMSVLALILFFYPPKRKDQ
jgi:hypothetical protein